VFWMLNPFVGVPVPATTKLIELGGNCRGKNGKRCESSEEHQNVSYKFSGYSRQRPFIYVGINIYYVECRILQLLGHSVPHRRKTSRYHTSTSHISARFWTRGGGAIVNMFSGGEVGCGCC
jgi:hypothetical protein